MRERHRAKVACRKFYDRNECNKLFKLFEQDIFAAKLGYERYLIKYPNDMGAYLRYVHILISLGEYDEVEEILNKVEHAINTKSHYNQEGYNKKYYTDNINYYRAKLYAFQNKPWDALHIMFKHPESFGDVLKYEKFYLRSLVNNKIDKSKRDDYSYIYRQITDYREEDFIDHIKKHEADYNENDKEISTAFFVPDFPLEKVIEEVKKRMPESVCINHGFSSNYYYFRFDECGRHSDKLVDYFRVGAFNGTDKLITMFPTDKVMVKDVIDLSYLKEDENTPKVKRMSQIDKFNQRYKLK